MDNPKSSNRRTAAMLALVVVGMFGFGFAMVPLYGLICQVAGIQSANSSSKTAAHKTVAATSDRMVTVRFDTTVQNNLPWEFRPNVGSLRVPVGKMQYTSFTARNVSDRNVTGQAVPSVVPWQAGQHFAKTECFCFRRQTLAAGEAREMPLAFNISPALPEGIDSITLSYSFMNVDAALNPVSSAGETGSR